MGKIKLKNIRCYSFHGCLKEETKIGSEYLVNLTVKTNLKKSSGSDNLKDTVDYVALNAVVVREMKKPSKLLEAVAGRIIDGVFDACALIRWANVSVAKINPPLGGDVEKVVVVLEKSRS